MKVLFFLLDGPSNASSNLRAIQYFPLLREAGVTPVISSPVPPKLYEQLVERSAFGMKQKSAFYSLFLASRLAHVLQSARFDAAVIQRDLFPFGPPWLERLLFKVTPHLAYDTDDPVYIRPSFTPNTVFQKLRRFDKVAEVVRHSRFVSVSTEPIARWARQFNPDNVRVVPMVLTMDPYESAYTQRAERSGAEVVIGWSGTGGSVQYLESLAPALRRVAEKYPIKLRVVSGAYASVRLPGVPLDAQPWTPHGVLPTVAGFDIGLTPLHDEPFEREKFPSKALQYMALRVPVLASRVGTIQEVIREGENGLLAGDEDEWVERLGALAADVSARKRLGEAGYETVLERFTVQKAAPTLIEGLRQAAR